MQKLYEQKYPFIFDGEFVVFNSKNEKNGEIAVSYSFGLYQISYGVKGFPYLEIKSNADDVISFVMKISGSFNEQMKLN